jgi:crotonobetainyl-CoA:carnitine CoA-transferase CaiB-like acyl-CoA transferase
VLIYTKQQWERFTRAIRRPDLFDVSAGDAERDFTETVNGIIGRELLNRTTAQWMAVLVEEDIPAAELFSMEDVIEDPHLRQVGAVSLRDHPTEGTLLHLAQPSRWSGHLIPCPRHAPQLGEHSREILSEVGYSDEEIGELESAGTVLRGAARDN